jgi:hypothetical protein
LSSSSGLGVIKSPPTAILETLCGILGQPYRTDIMSLDIKVYCRQLSDDLIPQIVKRLNDYDMVVEVYPDFSFNDYSGFLPFKFQLTKPHLDMLKGKELKSGFELYIDDFNLTSETQALRPKLSFFNKLLGQKQPDVQFASPDIEKLLQVCNKVASFVWHSGDSFELRFASLTSAILTELTNGVCTYPADDIWYDNKNIVEEGYKEVCDYERTLTEKNIQFHEFDEW